MLSPTTRDAKHRPEPMRIGVSTAGDATLQAHRKAFTFGRVARQRTRALGCLLGVAKINNRLIFWPRDVAMLVSILRQYAATNCGNFKAPHDMAVAIGATNKAKVHFGRGR